MSADPSRAPGGQGEAPGRSDLKLYEQALRNEWPIPAKVRNGLLQRMINLVLPYDPWAPEPSPDATDVASWTDEPEPDTAPRTPRGDRISVSAMRVIVAMCSLNLKQQSLDLARRKVEGDPDARSLDQITREAEARARHRIATRGPIGRP